MARLDAPATRVRLREMGDSVARAEIDPDSAATQVLDWLGAGSRE